MKYLGTKFAKVHRFQLDLMDGNAKKIHFFTVYVFDNQEAKFDLKDYFGWTVEESDPRMTEAKRICLKEFGHLFQ